MVTVQYRSTGYSDPHFQIVKDLDKEVPGGAGRNGGPTLRLGILSDRSPAWMQEAIEAAGGRRFRVRVVVPQVGRSRFAFTLVESSISEFLHSVDAEEQAVLEFIDARKRAELDKLRDCWGVVCETLNLTPDTDLSEVQKVIGCRPIAMTSDGEIVTITGLDTLVVGGGWGADVPEQEIRRHVRLAS